MYFRNFFYSYLFIDIPSCFCSGEGEVYSFGLPQACGHGQGNEISIVEDILVEKSEGQPQREAMSKKKPKRPRKIDLPGPASKISAGSSFSLVVISKKKERRLIA